MSVVFGWPRGEFVWIVFGRSVVDFILIMRFGVCVGFSVGGMKNSRVAGTGTNEKQILYIEEKCVSRVKYNVCRNTSVYLLYLI